MVLYVHDDHWTVEWTCSSCKNLLNLDIVLDREYVEYLSVYEVLSRDLIFNLSQDNEKNVCPLQKWRKLVIFTILTEFEKLFNVVLRLWLPMYKKVSNEYIFLNSKRYIFFLCLCAGRENTPAGLF